jgi:hypothetical protein
LSLLVSFSSIVSILLHDCTSWVMLTCYLYNAFVGILDNTMSTCTNSLSGICVAVSSICNMSFVTLNVGLVRAVVWMDYSICGVFLISIVVSPSRKDFVPLSDLYAILIFSRTCFIPVKSSCIYPLWCLASSKSYVTWSCTFSATRSTLSSMSVYSSGSLCTFSLFHVPPDYEIGRLGGPSSWGVDA